METKEQVKQEGFAAYCFGQWIDENPYLEDTEEHSWWELGNLKAEKLSYPY